MTRKDIIRMAQEAGFLVDEKSQQHQPNCIFHTWHMIDEGLERFTALVAAAEREACAQILDHNANACANNSMLRDVLQGNATAIRARKENT